MKTVAMTQFLTEAQIALALRLYETYGMDAKAKIQSQIIEPNMAAINAKLGQENSASYLAYAVVYIFSQATQTTAAVFSQDDDQELS